MTGASHLTARRALGAARAVAIPAGGRALHARLTLPATARGVALLVLDDHERRDRAAIVAGELHRDGFATLECDLATPDGQPPSDEPRDADVPLLAARLAAVAEWTRREEGTAHLPIGCLGTGTAAAAALIEAASTSTPLRAVVTSEGRPDLAGHLLPHVRVPTLLLVGAYDEPLVSLNRDALARLGGIRALEIIPRAAHLLAARDAAVQVARHARHWFERYLGSHGLRTTTSGGGW